MFFDDHAGKKPAPVTEPGGAGFSQGTTGYGKTGLPGNDSCAPAAPQYNSQYSEFIEKPDGLLGDIAEVLFNASIRPVHSIALASSIALLAGICGRAFNISGVGLNQYIMFVGETGVGKEMLSQGPDMVIDQVVEHTSTKAIADFRGAGDFSSYMGGYRALTGKSKSIYCNLGELGKKLAEIASNRNNPNLFGIERFLLQAYSKSGKGQTLQPTSYSDVQKNPEPLHAPALTVMGEATTEIYSRDLDGMIASGLLPRMLWIEYLGQRTARNRNPVTDIPHDLLSRVADLAATSLTHAHNGTVEKVGFADQRALAVLDAFDEWCDNEIRRNGSEAIKHLWNRAHLKALKLAALQAVGVNPHNPLISERWAEWSVGFVRHQTSRLVAKFETGEVGAQLNDEGKQLDDLIRQVSYYLTGTFDEAETKYGGVTFEMHGQGVVTLTHIQRRVFRLASYRKDKMGQTYALKRAIKSLLEADELREIPKAQMQTKYGTGSIGYAVSNPTRFLKVRKPG